MRSDGRHGDDGAPRSRVPGTALLLFWAILALLALAVRTLDLGVDTGLVNVATGLLAVVFLATAIVWFVARSGWPRAARLVVGSGAILTLIAIPLLFRVAGVSGSMVPRLVPRFAEAHDRTLAAVPAGAEPGAVADLAPVGPGDYPQFLGPDRDAAVDHVAIAPDWETTPPELLWRRPIGAGWSGFAAVNGFAVTLEQRGNEQLVTCYEVSSGEPVWSHAIPGRYEDVVAGIGPRSTPTIDDGMVYALAATGTLVALDGARGELVWQADLLEIGGMDHELERQQIPYGRPNSPLVVDGLLVVPVGGDPAGRHPGLVAFDKKTGEVVWRSPDRQISMSSPVRATLAGVDQILIVNEDSVTGHAPDTGAIVWEHPWPGHTSADANVSQAVPLPPDRVFLSKGYGQGAALLRLEPAPGGEIRAEELWHNPRVLRTKLTNVTVHEGHVYGLSDGILECVDLETGRRVWKHGRYHHGQLIRVGALLVITSEDGEVFLVEASPERRDNVLGSVEAVEGTTWNNAAIIGDVLLVRSNREAAAFRLPIRTEGDPDR